jgi:hypothetical protein
VIAGIDAGVIDRADVCEANVVFTEAVVGLVSVTVNVIGAGLFGVNAVTGPPLNIPAADTPTTFIAARLMVVPIAPLGSVGVDENV